MRFSLLQKEPNYMYIYNPYIFTAPEQPLTMEAFIAPADFDPNAQELNIVQAFAAYSNVNKKYVFSVSPSVNSTLLPAVSTRSYACSENGSGYTILTFGTINWTVGSTKRHIVVIDSVTNINAAISVGGVWAYASKGVNSIQSTANTYIRWIHCEDLSSITSLQYNAFSNCSNLEGNLNLPSGLSVLEVGNGFGGVFSNCKKIIGSITIPSGMTQLGGYAFDQCSGITAIINLNSANITEIGVACFRGCSGLQMTLELPVNLSIIRDYSFSGCSNISGDLRIPRNVTHIGLSAFQGCSSLTFLDMLGSIVETMAEGNGFEGCFYGCSNISGTLVIPSTMKTIGNFSFTGCSNIQSYFILAMVAPAIGNYSFREYHKPLFVPSGATGYDVSPWTDTNIFSSITYY